MRTIILVIIIAFFFTVAASQSRMRPAQSLEEEQGAILLNTINIDSRAEPLTYKEHELHNKDLIYRRSRFADMNAASDDSTDE